MKELLRLTEVRQLTEDVENGVSPVLITGVSPVHRAQVEAALHLETRRPLVVLCPDEREGAGAGAGWGARFFLEDPPIRSNTSFLGSFSSCLLGILI